MTLASLSACGSADNSSSATGSYNAKARKAHKAAASAPGAPDLADMVAAVSANKSGPPVEVKFALVQKPEVGQPLELDVAVIPGAPPPDAVSVAFQVTEGLEIVDGADAVKVEKPAEGAPIRRIVKILPKRDGIFAVTTLVTLTNAHESPTRTFSIPVIAGQGVPELAAKPEAAKGL